MKAQRLVLSARILLGAIFILGPLATALRLAPEPVLPPNGAAFMGALAATGYMLPLLLSTEIAAGVLVLSGLVPLGLVLLAPVIANIDAFHIFLAPKASAPGIVVSALALFLAWEYRKSFAGLFQTVRLRTDHTTEVTVRAASKETPARVHLEV